MTEETMTAEGGDRGLVRIQRGSNGKRTWAVTVRAGDKSEDLVRAYEIAREIEARLDEGHSPE